jgi:meiosis induction protein kinase IME2/SME1
VLMLQGEEHWSALTQFDLFEKSLTFPQVAIKTMKKTFDSFSSCLELREVIFLRSLPSHPHLVPALDIFLDPYSKKLHIAMEYMDGNLYQLMKARDHKYLDAGSVRSILFQIISGLEHIHQNNFFHRDIKPENILVSSSAPHENGNAFRRYSSLVTPPSTPPSYSIKIADFGLARETHSNLPYTTYVSTRWYRAPEVLLRAGEYSAPVDIWAVGAMAVEIATLKPLFPGGNEVDQVWRVCEIMGSPGSWVNKHGGRVGGGDWKEGVRLAHKLGFSFPKVCSRSRISQTLHIYNGLLDGSTSDGEYPSGPTVASQLGKLRNLVFAMGS